MGNQSNKINKTNLNECSPSSKFRKWEKDGDIIRCCIIGDSGVGKTTLSISYTSSTFPEDYIPTVFDPYDACILHENKKVVIEICDQSCTDKPNQGDQTNHHCYVMSKYGRRKFYTERDGKSLAILICFSIIDRESFDHVKQWKKEIDEDVPGVPIILIGTKLDLREEKRREGIELVEKSEGEIMARDLGCSVQYIECSSKTNEGLKEVFQGVIKEIIGPK